MVSKTSLLLPLSLSCLVGSFIFQLEAVASQQENLPSAVDTSTTTVTPKKIIEEDSEPEATTETSVSITKQVKFDMLSQGDSGEGDLSQTLTQSVRPKSKRAIGAPKSNFPWRKPSRALSTTISRTASSCPQNPQGGSSPSE